MTKKKIDWPKWTTPSDNELINLAKTLFPFIKLLSPDIVKRIVEDNNKNQEEWTNAFNEFRINPKIYLWTNSPVVFPGIRRHSGKIETSNFRNNLRKPNANNSFLLDDNAYPKEVWSFSLRNKKYDRTNPPEFSLAHIVDHKDYKYRNTKELIGKFPENKENNLFAGLYTSCVNTIWVPVTLLKPTDHNSKLRKLLHQLIFETYKDVCNILPYNLAFKLDDIEEIWLLKNFPKPEIIGNYAYIDNFINYRNNIINEQIKYNRQHDLSISGQ